MFQVINCLTNEHDWRLVVVAAVICFFASLSAITLLNRARAVNGAARATWTLTAGATGGCGIWATHFIAMLAYEPGVAIAYDIGLTGLSLLIAIVISSVGFAFAIYNSARCSSLVAGAIVGAGVASMHYLGMSAIDLPGRVTWSVELVVASVIAGMAFGAAAIAIAMRGNSKRTIGVAVLLLTLAIVTLHFIAMGAILILPDPTRVIAVLSLSPASLSFVVAVAAMAIMGASFIGAMTLAEPFSAKPTSNRYYAHFQRVIFLILVIVLIAAGYLAKMIRDQQNVLAGVSHYNIVWAATRMSADVNRFGQTLAEFALPGRPANNAQLQLRAGIVKNRLEVMSHGEFLQFTTDVATQGQKVVEVRNAISEILAATEDLKADAVPDLLEELSAIQTSIAQIVSAAREYNSEQEQGETEALLRLHSRFSVIMIVLIGFGCILLFTVNLQNKWMKKSHGKLKEVADNLTKTTVSRQHLDAAINNMSQALCLVDRNDRIVIWNDQFPKMFGIPADLIDKGEKFSRIFVDKDCMPGSDSAVREVCNKLKNSAKLPQPARFIQEFENGQVIEVSQRPISDGWVATFEDITSRRTAELERMRALADAEVAREREQIAMAANQAKSSFLAMMSHEIRTPMNAVLGLSSTLLEEDLGDDQRIAVRAIYESGGNLLNILNDILDYSKLESGQLNFEMTPFCPEAVVNNTISIVDRQASSKSLPIRIAIGSDLPAAVTGDAGRIRQVLLNLVGNAVKFTEAGEVVVGIRLVALEGGRATLEWRVSDTGIGISPDRIGALFTDFTQADSSITRRFGGTGLGLAICKRIVEQMGGKISVTSTPGVGSTFLFTLTLGVASVVSQTENGDDKIYDELKARIALLGRPLRILITDDNTTNRLIAARMLKDFNVQTFMACNGIEAVNTATDFPLDVILMDMRMPEMDGLQATKLLRARGGNLGTVPIIAFTANAFDEDLKACRDSGMSGLIAKPVRKRKLVEVILEAHKGDVGQSTSAIALPVVLAPNLDGQTNPSDEASTKAQTIFAAS